MKKNGIILILVIALGVGGWLLYSPHKANAPATNTTSSNQAANGAVLDYSHHNLTSVGSDIYGQTSATELVLSYNDLTSLPSQLGGMNHLQVLRLDHNKLQGSLVAEIRKMPLTTLDASYNDMTGVPAEIGQLTKLETLNYSYNHISTLPNEMANIKQLKTLNLTGNPLSATQIAWLKAKLPQTTIVF